MDDKKLQPIINSYNLSLESKTAPLIETGRKNYPLAWFPEGLDFTKTIGGTTYSVRSYFNPKAGECLYAKVNRLILGDPNLRGGQKEG